LVVEGKPIGFLGSVHPVLLDQEKIRVQAALAEMDLEPLFKGQPRSKRAESLSRFPAIKRDLALMMKASMKVSEVEQVIRKEAGAHLTEVEVFDVFAGESVGLGLKSVAIRLTYQDKKDTLGHEIVKDSVDKVLQQLKTKFQITVR
jgi:phenylalanyl-tRNA synthetase beta chain